MFKNHEEKDGRQEELKGEYFALYLNHRFKVTMFVVQTKHVDFKLL